jgi:rSAM/selenodomain-associated transferase 2
MISIIIPVKNEERQVAHALDSIYRQGYPVSDFEVIIGDSGSTDKTCFMVQNFIARNNISNIRIISYPAESRDARKPNRARVMNFCASNASGNILLFLHADSVLPRSALSDISSEVENGVVAGAFLLKFNDRNPLFRIGELGIEWRTLHLHYFCGEQGIFVRADVFRHVQGYRDVDMMEDVNLCKRLRNKFRISIIRKYMTVSARKYKKHGILNQYLDDQIIKLLFRIGLDNARLRKMYLEIRSR